MQRLEIISCEFLFQFYWLNYSFVSTLQVEMHINDVKVIIGMVTMTTGWCYHTLREWTVEVESFIWRDKESYQAAGVVNLNYGFIRMTISCPHRQAMDRKKCLPTIIDVEDEGNRDWKHHLCDEVDASKIVMEQRAYFGWGWRTDQIRISSKSWQTIWDGNLM